MADCHADGCAGRHPSSPGAGSGGPYRAGSHLSATRACTPCGATASPTGCGSMAPVARARAAAEFTRILTGVDIHRCRRCSQPSTTHRRGGAETWRSATTSSRFYHGVPAAVAWLAGNAIPLSVTAWIIGAGGHSPRSDQDRRGQPDRRQCRRGFVLPSGGVVPGYSHRPKPAQSRRPV